MVGISGVGVSVDAARVSEAVAQGVKVLVSSVNGVLRGAGGATWQPASSPASKVIQKNLLVLVKKQLIAAEELRILIFRNEYNPTPEKQKLQPRYIVTFSFDPTILFR